MTDYKEEQEGEVEALRSIYPEEELKGRQTLPSFRHLLRNNEHESSACPYAVISEDPYCLEVKVSVEDSEIEGSQGKCGCTMHRMHCHSNSHDVSNGHLV